MDTMVIFWIVFHLLIAVALLLDLEWFQRKAHSVSMKEAVWTSIFWISLALLFNLAIYIYQDSERALDFFTCYLLEKSLSVDNLFVFLVIFKYFHVPEAYRHKVLFWGVLGAIVMRASFILVGIALIEAFSWVLVIMGIILAYSGFRLLFTSGPDVHPEQNVVLKVFRRYFPMTESYENGYFWIRRAGVLLFTPLMLVLIVVETTDVMFAFDSIPAVIGITQDPFIVYTSNIFAILGLRAMFFVLQDLARIFTYLHYGLGAILIFIGMKMIVSPWFHFSVTASLFVILGLLTISIIASLIIKPKVTLK